MHTTSWKPFWRAFPLLALVPIGTLVAYINAVVAENESELRRLERLSVDLEFEAVNRGLNQVATDICTLSQQNELLEYLNTGDAKWLEAIEREYLVLSENEQLYDQIRFLSNEGMEVVRVNFDGEQSEAVEPENLQDKSQRYYFIESLNLQPGEIYISPLDLNVERGEVEIPYKPMIRVGTPVADATGRVRGVVLINFLAQSLLDRVVASGTLSAGDPIMLNGDGYWLISPDPPPSWGFMFPEQTGNTLSVIDPDAWDHLNGHSQGDIVTDRGLLTFESYLPLAEIDICPTYAGSHGETEPSAGYRWILASHVSADALAEIARKAILEAMAIGIPVLVLLAVGTRATTVVTAQRRRHQDRLEALARFDSLTQLANRTTFEERLSEEQKRAHRHGRRFAVLYLDLDGFKAINDTLGHHAGDRVLIDVARILEGGCRAVDTPARLGGDEFALLLSEVADAQASHAVARRVRDRIVGLTYDQMSIGVSIGIALWPDHTEDPSQIIRLADAAMYEAKTAGGNQIQEAGAS